MANWPDVSFPILILSWMYITRQFHYNKTTITHQAIQNKFILYLLILSYLLNAFFITLIVSMMIIVLFVIIKLVVLEQVSVDGVYPYSTENILRNILGYVVRTEYLWFYLKLFVLLNMFTFACILFILPEEKDKEILHSQIETLMNGVLLLSILSYIIWNSYSDNTLMFYMTVLIFIVFMVYRFMS